MKKVSKAPTLDDVAREAEVSTATISRYLNSPEVVAKKTGERIRIAVDKIGYIPNASAGELASSRSKMVAVLIPHLENSLFAETIERMVDELTTSGNNVMLGLTRADKQRTEDLVRAALARRVDAIISTGPLDKELADLIKRSNVLVIEVWQLPENPVGVAIGFSHQDVGRDIARFLISRGYRRPHLITSNSPRARYRRSGFLKEWQELGHTELTESIVEVPTKFGQARRIFADMRHLDERPDVVICSSDHLAQGVIVEAQASGLRVPEDLGVMGFGNNTIAGEMRPTITSIDVDGARIAREAMAVLKRHQEGGDFNSRKIDVGFRLISRDSV